MANFTLVYDGLCPLCNAYVCHIRIMEAVPTLKIIDARKNREQIVSLTKQGVDINKGMALIIDGVVYFGGDCIHMLALLSSRSSWFNKINAAIFSNRYAAKLLYPIMRMGRGLLLKLLGIPLINTAME